MANIMTQQMILVNYPIFDRPCKYYHTHSGCKYGEHCYYKHLQPCSASPYQTLLQYHQMNNQLLHQILTCLQQLISNTTTTTTQPDANPPKPTSALEFNNNSATPMPTPAYELKRDTPTPTPAPTTAPTRVTNPPTIDIKCDNNSVTKAVKMYQNLKQNPVRSPQASPNTSFYCHLKKIWPNIQCTAQFEQPPQPQIITAQHRAQMIQQIDIEYRELFYSMS